jgi:hypothetical protein
MERLLHITSGGIAGDSLKRSGISGAVFVWHDILCDAPGNPAWTTALHGLTVDRIMEDEKLGLCRENGSKGKCEESDPK